MKKVEIKFTAKAPYAPHQATEGAVGYDLTVAQDTLINPGQVVLVPTGLRMEIPKGYHGKMFLRSSTGVKTPLRLANQVGIIDSDYRGEIKMPLENTSNRPYRVFEGDRLCQIIIEKNVNIEYVEAEKLNETLRGEGGFGSTTKKGKKNE